MAWTHPGDPVTAKVANQDLSASYRMDTFNDGQGGTEQVLACFFTIANDGSEDKTVSFRLDEAVDMQVEMTPQQFLIACRDYALPLAGYSQS